MDAQGAQEIGTAILAALGGAGLAVLGMLKWLGDVVAKRIADEEAAKRESALDVIRQEHLKLMATLEANLQRTVLVDKVRFEHEYQIYRDLWANSVHYQTTAANLALAMQDGVLARVAPIHKAYSDAYDSLTKELGSNRPFLPEEIFTAFWKLQDAMHNALAPARDDFVAGKPVPDCFKALWPVDTLSVEISKLIQARLAEVRVV
jgi:hypothetical protein